MARVLLLRASFGEGHNQAAFAVGEALEQRGAAVKIVDYVEWLHPALRSFAKFSLKQGVQKVPLLYGFFYKSMARIQPKSSIQRQLNHLGITKLKKCLSTFRPDAVACTFPTPSGVLSELIARGYTTIPNTAIITDYTAHGQWVQENLDRYFVASKYVRDELMSHGVAPERIVVTGIPLRSKFSADTVARLTANREQLFTKYDLDPNIPVVLLMGGGEGLLGESSAWESMINKSQSQFIIVCGRNQRLLRRMQNLSSERVHVVGYTTEVHELMAVASLIITKPGGLTVTEAFVMSLPMLLYRPIPGQEEKNARYAVETGAAKLVYDVREASKFLQSIERDSSYLMRMREAARRENMSSGAERIADELFKLSGESFHRSHHVFV